MNCNIVFDFHSPHNNEYWYHCTKCGATDWFSYYNKPAPDKPIDGCNPNYKPTPHEAVSIELRNYTRDQLIGEIVKYRQYIAKLEQFQEQAYTIYPDMAVALEKNREDGTN